MKQLFTIAALMSLGVMALFLPRLLTPRVTEAPLPDPVEVAENYPLRFLDGADRKVTIPERPERVISLAPSLTEMAFFLGVGDRLIGRSKYDLRPEAAIEVPVVGDISTPQIERVLALTPDLILATRLTSRDVVYQFEQLRLNVVVYEHAGIEGTFRDMQQLSTILDAPPAGLERLSALKERKAALEERTAGLPLESHPRTLVLLGTGGFYSAGSGTFPSEMIRLAGGYNVADAQETAWPQLSMESILDLDPEVILIAQDKGEEANDGIRKVISQWENDPVWKNVSAIRNRRVHIMNDSAMTVPGPRMIDTAGHISSLLFPDTSSAE